MLHHQEDFLNDLARDASRRPNSDAKHLSLRVEARILLHLRDMSVSPRRFCRDAMRKLCEARKIDLSRPHPDEVYAVDENGKPMTTYGEHWKTPESYDDDTGLPIYPPDSPLAPAAAEALAKEKALIAAEPQR